MGDNWQQAIHHLHVRLTDEQASNENTAQTPRRNWENVLLTQVVHICMYNVEHQMQ